ncbi:hypothetical protein [Rosistilla oblonga]|uniref:hypothetical protein n=1 Tax=Rosistilla oblonga TaxID=2527990 RepID=UPI003A97EE72
MRRPQMSQAAPDFAELALRNIHKHLSDHMVAPMSSTALGGTLLKASNGYLLLAFLCLVKS